MVKNSENNYTYILLLPINVDFFNQENLFMGLKNIHYFKNLNKRHSKQNVDFSYFNCLIKILFIIITFATRFNYHHSLKKHQIQWLFLLIMSHPMHFEFFLKNQKNFLIVFFRFSSYRLSAAEEKTFQFIVSLRISLKHFNVLMLSFYFRFFIYF